MWIPTGLFYMFEYRQQDGSIALEGQDISVQTQVAEVCRSLVIESAMLP